jgi:transforming growth factor-beta-induced protein
VKRRLTMLALSGAFSLALAACGGAAPSTGDTTGGTTDPLATTTTGDTASDATSVTGSESGSASGGTSSESTTTTGGASDSAATTTTDGMSESTATTTTGGASDSAATTTTDGMSESTATTTTGGASDGAATTTTEGSGASDSASDPLAALEADGRFTTLVTAIRTTGLDQQLNQLPEFTLFAPTDEAFLALPQDQLQGLLNNPQQLSDILLFHVADQKLMASEVTSGASVETLAGQPLTVSGSGSSLMLNSNAMLIDTDIEVGNGVVHVIDQVLVPGA